MKIDLAGLDYDDIYNLMTSSILPRPVIWISTIDKAGVFNLAPFSAFCTVSIIPAMVGFCVGTDRNGQKKDTLRNVQTTKDFSVNMVVEDLAKPMNITSKKFPADIDEFKEAGLTPVPADLVKSPLVAESPVNMECRLNQILEFGEGPRISSFVIGEVLRFHIKDYLFDDGKINMINILKSKIIGRLGGGLYCRVTDSFKVKSLD